MIIKIKNKEYTVAVGNRAIINLRAKADLDKLVTGQITFDDAVSCYWDSIKDKGKLTKEQLGEYVDTTPKAITYIFEAITAFSQLDEEAKK